MMSALLDFVSSEYVIHLGILLCIYAILAQGFNIVFGLGGLFNLAHVAFFAVGAYASALLSTDFGWTLLPCLVTSTLLSGLFALLVGEISLVLSKDYFAMGTLSFAAIVSALLTNWKSLTRGVLGIPGIPRLDFFGLDSSIALNFLLMAALLCLLSQCAAYLFFRSKAARSLRALALDEYSSQAMGRNPRVLRNLSFFLSACFAGLAGSLFAFYLNYIDPSSFTLSEMVLVLTIAIVAKPGSFWGIIPSVILIVILIPEGLRWCELRSSVLGPMRQLLNALILFTIVFVFRKKLFPQQREV